MRANDKTTPIPAIENPSSADRCLMCREPYNTTTRSWVPMSCGHAFCSKCLANKKRTVFKCSECQQPTMVRYNPPRKGHSLSVEKVLFNKIPNDCPSVEPSSSNPSSEESRSPLASVPSSDSDIRSTSDDDNAETKAQQFGGDCSEHADLIRKLMEQNHEYRRQIGSFKKILRDLQYLHKDSSDPQCQRILDRLHHWQLHQDPEIPTSETPPFQLHTSQNVPPSFQAPPVFVPNRSMAAPPTQNAFNQSMPAFHRSRMAPAPIAAPQPPWFGSSYGYQSIEMAPPMMPMRMAPYPPQPMCYQNFQVYQFDQLEPPQYTPYDVNGDQMH
uniref:RING-type domain-containing protein n=1 Tax=Panagrellus redivivus TaxID=6233 RepID=A0A7E4VAR4_PANRE